jgi:hypothetical protein
MPELSDDRITALYFLARQEYAAAITDEQKLAVEQLKEFARQGNQDAALALTRLQQLPNIHPFIKEVLAA